MGGAAHQVGRVNSRGSIVKQSRNTAMTRGDIREFEERWGHTNTPGVDPECGRTDYVLGHLAALYPSVPFHRLWQQRLSLQISEFLLLLMPMRCSSTGFCGTSGYSVGLCQALPLTSISTHVPKGEQ